MGSLHRMVGVVALSSLLSGTACAPGAGVKPPDEPLLALVDLAAQRVQTADTVAAAKWGTGAPINDPAREQAVLADVAMRSTERGMDPATSVQVLTDQIEANKAVQYALYARWSAHPDQAPSVRSDLAQIRPVLDRITAELLGQLKLTQAWRAGPGCATHLASARLRAQQARVLDQVHSDALSRALASLCGGHKP